MIVDSHAHYNNGAYLKPCKYLSCENGAFTLKEGDLAEILAQMEETGILCSVEPGVSAESCRQVLDLCARHPGRLFPAMGVHPTRSIREPWKNRKQLREMAALSQTVAIGETGLDYHYPRKEQYRLRQHIWFLYQLQLAWKLKKPVILHVRDAHAQALRILKHHPARKLGGVIHCFYGSREIAEEYLRLGYHIGIGGSLLQQEERAGQLWEAVRHIPLERILLETDAPYILPYCKDVLPGKALRRARNTSLILPRVAAKIGELKGISPETVEYTTAENAVNLFRLPITL